MTRLLTLMLIGFFVLTTAVSQYVGCANSATAGTFSAQSVSGAPLILYAEWFGKNLSVEGKNFSDGATMIVDGQELRSSNNENHPALFLLAKKAKKKVPRNQTIILQVRNPDGELSNEFTFLQWLRYQPKKWLQRHCSAPKGWRQISVVLAARGRATHSRMVRLFGRQ